MKISALPIQNACRIEMQAISDERGAFGRIFCADEFVRAGLPRVMVQASISFNQKRGTIRGMHFQWPPSHEGKLVRCVRGAVFDVIVDLRPESPSYLQHVALELSGTNHESVFIPHGVAHGFQTLEDSTEVLYQMTDVYAPNLATGFRWNDPAFGIDWPIGGDVVISRRDAEYPDFDRASFELELGRRRR